MIQGYGHFVRDCGSALSLHRLLRIGEMVPNRRRIDGVLVILNGIYDQDVFRSDLYQQNRDVCSVANGSRSNDIQPVHQQPHTIDEFSRAGALGGRGLAKLGEQLANVASSMRRYRSSNSFQSSREVSSPATCKLIWGDRYRK
jgi:hypothetical protein